MPQQLLVTELAEIHENVFACWGDLETPLTPDEVLAYSGPIPRKMEPYEVEWFKPRRPAVVRTEHIQRIHVCLRNPDQWPALWMDQNQYGTFTLEDGHHRLAAAVLLGLKSVRITWGGIWRDLRQQFPRSYRAGLLRLAFDEYQPKHK